MSSIDCSWFRVDQRPASGPGGGIFVALIVCMWVGGVTLEIFQTVVTSHTQDVVIFTSQRYLTAYQPE